MSNFYAVSERNILYSFQSKQDRDAYVEKEKGRQKIRLPEVIKLRKRATNFGVSLSSALRSS